MNIFVLIIKIIATVLIAFGGTLFSIFIYFPVPESRKEEVKKSVLFFILTFVAFVILPILAIWLH